MSLIQTDTTVWTFADCVEHLLDTHAIGREPLNLRNARKAVLEAYRDLPNLHCWSYYYRQRIIQTAASYSTGTVAFDFSGGANERQLTLTTGTWPSWASFGRVIIGGVHYEVESRVSDSIVTLRANSNPGADVASGTTFQIYRAAYTLPADFRKFGQLWDVDQERRIPIVDQAVHHAALNVYYSTPSTPWQATIRATDDYYGALSLIFGPPPDSLRSYDFLYEVAPRPLRIDQATGGTVAITGTAVTGTNTNFPADCVGSILRVSPTGVASNPTGVAGGLSDTDNRFDFQGVIKTRTSSTALVLEEGPAANYTGSGYVISDPIDIEAGAMLTAFLRAAEAAYEGFAGRDQSTKLALAQRALSLAIEADQRNPNPQVPLHYNPFRHVNISDG